MLTGTISSSKPEDGNKELSTAWPCCPGTTCGNRTQSLGYTSFNVLMKTLICFTLFYIITVMGSVNHLVCQLHLLSFVAKHQGISATARSSFATSRQSIYRRAGTEAGPWPTSFLHFCAMLILCLNCFLSEWAEIKAEPKIQRQRILSVRFMCIQHHTTNT